MFGKILAGEIRKPSSFSIKSVKLMGELDKRTASLFQRLASLTCSLRTPDSVVDARVVSLTGSAAQNSLLDYGLGFGDLNVLHEFGLIIPDYNSYMDYQVSLVLGGTVHLPLTFQNRQWVLVPEEQWSAGRQFRLSGVALSASGRELLRVVGAVPEQKYSTALQRFFRQKKVKMVEVSPHLTYEPAPNSSEDQSGA